MNSQRSTFASPFAVSNIRLFIAFRVFFNARFYYPVFTILFIDFGLTVSQFALMNAVWAATIVIMEVPSGALADIWGRRNLLILTSALMIIEMLLLCVVPRGYSGLLFTVFLINRVLSGTAEAAASGADSSTSDSSGGGGGGCSLSNSRQGSGSILEYFLPYAVLAVFMLGLRRRDRRAAANAQ